MYLLLAAKSLQSCPTLCDLIDGSPPGSPVPGILQARTLERVAISFSSAWKWKVKVKSLSRVQLLATPWTAAHQASPSMGFSRQEYWDGVPLPSPLNDLDILKSPFLMWIICKLNKVIDSVIKKTRRIKAPEQWISTIEVHQNDFGSLLKIHRLRPPLMLFFSVKTPGTCILPGFLGYSSDGHTC